MTLRMKLISRFVVGLFVSGLLLFLTAGTLRFWEAWAFLSIWFVPAIFFSNYFYKRDPELIERRLRSREKVRAQRIVMMAAYPIFFVAFLMPGLDFRLGWTRGWTGAVPSWLKIVSLGMVLGGYLVAMWVLYVNRYASRIIEVEEGQKVISTGPYRWVRHPLYSGSAVMMLFTPLALGSYVSLPFFALLIPIYVVRLLNEEKVLRHELPGYAKYCEETRYRLVPHVW